MESLIGFFTKRASVAIGTAEADGTSLVSVLSICVVHLGRKSSIQMCMCCANYFNCVKHTYTAAGDRCTEWPLYLYLLSHAYAIHSLSLMLVHSCWLSRFQANFSSLFEQSDTTYKQRYMSMNARFSYYAWTLVYV